MRCILSLSVPIVLFAAAVCGAETPSSQYVVHLALRQGSAQDPTRARILAEPTLAATDGREAQFHSGGELTLHGEVVDTIGSDVTLRVSSAGDGKARVRGKFVLSQALAQSDDVTGTTNMRVYFDRTVTLGRKEKLVLSGSDASSLWLEVLVEKARLTAD